MTYIHAHGHLTKEQVMRLFTAGENAYEMKRPLNRFITIHYDDFADSKRPQTFVINLMERVRKWLKQRKLPLAYLYVIENGVVKGIHVHILLYIPAGRQVEFKRSLKLWLPFQMKLPYVKFVTVQYPVYGTLSSKNALHGILRYMCKGIDEKTPVKGIRPLHQGTVMGRRWGISNTIRKALT